MQTPKSVRAKPQLFLSTSIRVAAALGVGLAASNTSLAFTDVIAPSNPVWQIPYGGAKIDGVISPGEWDDCTPIVRVQPNQYNATITLRYKYNFAGLFVCVDVKDDRVWIDGNAHASGNRWEFANDDGIGLYFDPDNSRTVYMGPSGRFLGVNIDKNNGPIAGNETCARYDYLKGDSKGWGVNVNPGAALTPHMMWRARVWGTPNNNADIDTGWTMEFFLPWNSVGRSAMPANGETMGLNFQWWNNNNGGERNYHHPEDDPNSDARLGPRILDDELQGVFSSFSFSWSGFNGPINYAEGVFVDPNAYDHPREITDLAVTDVTGYSARLDFTAPACSMTQNGSCAGYQIRVATFPIVGGWTWNHATMVVDNTFVPRNTGQHESLRIGKLAPGQTYYVWIRAVDGAGRMDDHFESVAFTTLNTAQDTSGGQRLMVSPAGGTLMTESGEPFVMIGSHAPPSLWYVRNLFPGDLWDGTQMINFYQHPGMEGDADGYFDSLASYGVNTLLVPLEWLPLDPNGRWNLPNGNYWIEDRPGHYNPNMRTFLHNMMAEAARTGIRLVLDPFNTYHFKDYFDLTPYSTANGGPLTSIDNFFQTPEVVDMVANRLKTVIDWVNESPYAYTVIGYEPVNEWDTHNWCENVAREHADADGSSEWRDRAQFLNKVARRIRAYDPEALLIHTGDEVVPRGPVARSVFYSDAFDILMPHLYTRTTSEPVNNPDFDVSVRPAVDYGGIAQYWTTSRRDNRPFNNGEWGLTSWHWTTPTPYYTYFTPGADNSNPFMLAQDMAIYRATSWTMLACGAAGTGLRLGDVEFRSLVPNDLTVDKYGYLPVGLPTCFREIQRAIANFVSDQTVPIDWTQISGGNGEPLAGRMTFTTLSGTRLLAWGTGQTDQGVAFLLADTTAGGWRGTPLPPTSMHVQGAIMTIDLQTSPGVGAEGNYVVEVWSTGGDSSVIGRFNTTATGGKLIFALPDFKRDAVLKYKKL